MGVIRRGVMVQNEVGGLEVGLIEFVVTRVFDPNSLTRSFLTLRGSNPPGVLIDSSDNLTSGNIPYGQI